MRTGVQYREHLSKMKSCIWYESQYFNSPADIPEMTAQIDSVGRYYDCHFTDPAKTFKDDDGDIRSIIHLAATTPDELIRKGEGLLNLTESYDGMLGRAPDYMGSGVSAWRNAYPFFGADFANYVHDLAVDIRHRDLFVTHTTTEIIDPSGNPVGVRAVRETPDGLILQGVRAMATSGPLSDLVIVLPNRLAKATTRESTLIVAIPTSTPGLTFVARRRLTGVGRLSMKYEETDALLLLENAFVPWSHVLVYGDTDRYLKATKVTGALAHGGLQAAARSIAKLRTIARLLERAEQLMTSARGDAFKAFCGRVLRDIELLDASYRRAIEHGSSNEFGLWLPHGRALEASKIYFMQSYPTLIGELRRLIAPDLFHLFQGAKLPERLTESLAQIWSLSPAQVVDRLDLTAELFDLVLSSFGMRQEMYEIYKAGSPDQAARYFWNAFSRS